MHGTTVRYTQPELAFDPKQISTIRKLSHNSTNCMPIIDCWKNSGYLPTKIMASAVPIIH